MRQYLITHKTEILITLLGFLGLLASAGYSLEILELSKNPGHIPTCSVDSIINCLGTMKSAESYILGFPNSFMGLAMYAAIFTYGFISLFTIEFPIILKKIALGISAFGFIFSVYLLLIGVFKLGVICPYCIMSFLAGTNIFFVLLWDKFRTKTYVYYLIIWHILVFAGLGYFYLSQ